MIQLTEFLYRDGQSLIIDENFLRDRYISQLKSLTEICEELGNNISVEGVRKNLKKYAIIRTPEEQRAAKQRAQERSRETVLARYGATNVSKVPDIKEKKKKTCMQNHGVECGFQSETCIRLNSQPKSEEWKAQRRKYATPEEKSAAIAANRRKYAAEKSRRKAAARLQEYGTLKHNAPGYLQKEVDTCMRKYGVPFPCMRAECRKYSSSNSSPNRMFSKILGGAGILFEVEFSLQSFSYDFKVDSTLIEIDPTITHNIDWSPFGDHEGINLNYHLKKTQVAEQSGFRCIHVFDWEEFQQIVDLVNVEKRAIPARKCDIHLLDTQTTRDFLSKYHMQSYTRNQPVKLGLYYGDELVQVMTLGKPRYTRTYEWELLRLATKAGVRVQGGASKLLKFFIRNYDPHSIISYCDRSKFTGDIYIKLGFQLKKHNIPSIHWYNPVTKQHITDNLLRKHGFDRLFNTTYGKGTSNSELMLSHGFYRVADCGQATYVLNLK